MTILGFCLPTFIQQIFTEALLCPRGAPRVNNKQGGHKAWRMYWGGGMGCGGKGGRYFQDILTGTQPI